MSEKIQCQWAQFATNGTPRCEANGTRKWGDHWFCEEHGSRLQNTVLANLEQQTKSVKSETSKDKELRADYNFLSDAFSQLKIVIRAYDKVINELPIDEKIKFINKVPEHFREQAKTFIK